MRYWAYTVIIVFSVSCAAQKKQAEKYLMDLASPEFYGRGYVNNGITKASNYIEKKFEDFKLKPFNDDYSQYFKCPVNTFPDQMTVAINGYQLTPGKDFIVDSRSGSYNTTKDIHTVKINLNNAYKTDAILDSIKLYESKAIYVLDPTGTSNQDTLVYFRSLKYELANIGPVFYINNDKLTWSVASDQLPFPIVELSDTLLSETRNAVSLHIKAQLRPNNVSRNIIGCIPAKNDAKKKPYKVVSAHYDHLGMMGQDACFYGANDNASGVAMMLLLAQHYAKKPPTDFNIVFIAFAGEEVGLVGSKYYTEHPFFSLEKIHFLLNLDLQGTGEEGITVVNATLHEKSFQTLIELNKANDFLPTVRKRGSAANSDHYHFTRKGVPAFFIYTNGGIKAYHDVYDKAETLPLTEFNDLYQLYIKFLDKI